MKNWDKKIFDETQELFGLFLSVNVHEKSIERIKEKFAHFENSGYNQRTKNYVQNVLNFIKANQELYFMGYNEFYYDLVFQLEDYLRNYNNYYRLIYEKKSKYMI